MPRDDWKKARDRQVGRRAAWQYANGLPETFGGGSDDTVMTEKARTGSDALRGLPTPADGVPTNPPILFRTKRARPTPAKRPKRRGRPGRPKKRPRGRGEPERSVPPTQVPLTRAKAPKVSRLRDTPDDRAVLVARLRDIAFSLERAGICSDRWRKNRLASCDAANSPERLMALAGEVANAIVYGRLFPQSWMRRQGRWLAECRSVRSVLIASLLLDELAAAVNDALAKLDAQIG